MEEYNNGSMSDEYPIIEIGVKIHWQAPASTTDLVDAASVTTIKDVVVDEDGVVQLAVVDTHPTTPDGRHSVSLQDLYERMNFQTYEITR